MTKQGAINKTKRHGDKPSSCVRLTVLVTESHEPAMELNSRSAVSKRPFWSLWHDSSTSVIPCHSVFIGNTKTETRRKRQDNCAPFPKYIQSGATAAAGPALLQSSAGAARLSRWPGAARTSQNMT